MTSWYDGEYITIDYGYNADGIRTFKEVYDADTGDTTRHEYILSGSQIIKETVFVNSVESYTLVYLYDEAGAPLGYRYRTPSYASGAFDGYFFEKNLQGDVVAVYSQSGIKLVSYIYDAWGAATTSYLNGGGSTAASFNPFRYRSYYFDTETSFYYLQSRYYNPTWGRFINVDGLAMLGASSELSGYNLFEYCANNPVMGYDPTGYVSWWGVLAGAVLTVAGVAVAVASYGVGSPLGAALIMQGGALIAATGIVTTTCAIEESAMVIDVSVSDSSTGQKIGNSLVIDFEDETFDLYAHDGITASTPNGSPLTYSVGKVYNYDDIGDYGGAFVNGGASYNWFGVDYCRSPDLDPSSTYAQSFTFGLPGTTGVNGYVGWDYYYQIGSWGGD